MDSRPHQQHLLQQLRPAQVLLLHQSQPQAADLHQQQAQQGGMQLGVCSHQAQQL
jgi:hypothetical protein